MNWFPTPIVRRAVQIRTVGMYVEDETGCHWGSLTIWNGSRRCQWCHAEFSTGWAGDHFRGSLMVCSRHIAVDWSAPQIEPALPTYMGAGDPIHHRPKRRRRAG